MHTQPRRRGSGTALTVFILNTDARGRAGLTTPPRSGPTPATEHLINGRVVYQHRSWSATHCEYVFEVTLHLSVAVEERSLGTEATCQVLADIAPGIEAQLPLIAV